MPQEKLLKGLNDNKEFLTKISPNVIINLSKTREISVPRKIVSFLFLITQPIKNAPIDYGEAQGLKFGKAFPLFTLNLSFGYLFVFPKCKVVTGKHHVAAIRRERESYSNTELLFHHDKLVVIGNGDATLLIRKEYELLPEFENI